MKQGLIVAALFIIIAGAAAIFNQKRKSEPQAQDDGWAQYDGPFIRFKYPKTWEASQWGSKGDERDWAIMPPGYHKNHDDIGVININTFPNKKESRPLEKIFDLKGWPNSTFVNPPKKISVKDGRCIAYSLEETRSYDAVSRIVSDCYDKDGLYYWIWADIGRYMQPGQPPPEVRENAKIYERILTSLEFL